MGTYDVTAKFLIEAGPADWQTMAGIPVPADPAAVTAIDADLATVANAPDKLVAVDDPVAGRHLVHVEFQSGADVNFDRRVLTYNVLARWRHGRPVRSVAYLLRPAAVTPHLRGGVYETLGDRAAISFDYQLVRVWELPVEAVLAGGLTTLPLAPIAAGAAADLPAVVGRVRDRLVAEVPPAVAGDYWQSVGLLMGLRYTRAAILPLMRGVMELQDSTYYQWLMEDSEARGEARGKIRGAVDGERNLLVRQATRRFGPPPLAAMAELDAVTDPAEMSRMEAALWTAESWEAWLGS